MKTKTTQARVLNTLDPFVRLGRGLEYPLIIQRGKGRNAEFIAGVHFADKPTRRELRQWRDAIIEACAVLAKTEGDVTRILTSGQWACCNCRNRDYDGSCKLSGAQTSMTDYCAGYQQASF